MKFILMIVRRDMFKRFLVRFLSAMEKIGHARARAELRRMGYTPAVLAKMTNENLERWV